jgi:hypothetical protein
LAVQCFFYFFQIFFVVRNIGIGLGNTVHEIRFTLGKNPISAQTPFKQVENRNGIVL